MEIKISTRQVLQFLHIVSWILFVGISIQAGGFIFNAVYALVSPGTVRYLWQEVDLSGLLQYNSGYFSVITAIMSIVAVVKAWLFFLVIKILGNKKLDMIQPFSKEVKRFIFQLTYLSFLIGLFSWWGGKYAAWLVKQGVAMPDLQHLQLGGADVWLFMSVTLFVLAQIFKRGIEIQSENELTI